MDAHQIIISFKKTTKEFFLVNYAFWQREKRTPQKPRYCFAHLFCSNIITEICNENNMGKRKTNKTSLLLLLWMYPKIKQISKATHKSINQTGFQATHKSINYHPGRVPRAPKSRMEETDTTESRYRFALLLHLK